MPVNGSQKAMADLLWGLRKPSSRGPRPAFDVDRIARAAVAVADADGLEAVSMQRVAAELGFTKMALYRYVNDKAELVAVMIEAAVGAPPDLSGVTGWRAELEEYARQLSAVWRRHPWLPSVTTGDRVMGPRETAWPESALGALAGTPLTERERLDVITLVSNHVRATHAAATPGTQTWTDGAAAPIMRDLLLRNADRFPLLAGNHATTPAGTVGDFGLRVILDGLEQAIARRATEDAARP
ncbi:TetR/AcrR family transcriptional regulator [Actinomadura sp. ATCC 31491]|uniref:TetR/AcrR family transcriptional regulator n=1 Tax=Actinomadura luzonensis TaxID=2805427 RepID=A0ABT0G5Q4_9ACTN|nr:TetR/AcrR family transcriptional regulator [Actinomadura luzonensis]MCK2219949.1 TetR/AcrR family transcriptional regulator [Actinomadura luzonensis]